MLRGEAIEAWRAEIGAMNYALERWRLAQTAKPGAQRLLNNRRAQSGTGGRKVSGAGVEVGRASAGVSDDCLEAVNSALPEKPFRLIQTPTG